MAEENGCNGHQVQRSTTAIEWKVGLMNYDKKYLTAESFGHKVNATGTAMKKKQIWVMEQEPGEEVVYVRSCQDCYMSTDKYGHVTVEAEERGEDEKFTVEYSENGQWALKSCKFANYFNGVGDKVECFDKSPGQANWWSIQLYVHPQIHLRNVNRKRYAHLVGDELECSELVPWGSDSLILLDFDEGKYTLKSFDNRYLHREGNLVEEATEECKFTMEIHSGCLAFKDNEGRYLTAVGKGTLKCRSKKFGKDELFTIEDSHPQVQIVSHNKKSVSIRQGVDVSANQNPDEIEDSEIFQMEFNKYKETWAFLGKINNTNKYWSLQPPPLGTVQILRQETMDDSFFAIDWQEDGTAGIKGNDGKYLSNKQTGILYSTTSTLEENNKFRIIIVNRPILVLKGEFGFVGAKGTQFICNKAKYDILTVEHVGEGSYTIKGQEGQYWNVGDDNQIYADSSPAKFQFQFNGRSMMAIRAPNGCFLKGEQTGLIKATSNEISSASLWEF
ncbi:Fascin [Mactra antiquata]